MAKVLKKALLDGGLLHPTEYVSAVELRGKDRTVTIAEVAKKEIPKAGSSKKDTCAVLTFTDAVKKLVLNKTNASAIVTMYGPNAKEWIGKRITLFPTTCNFGGDIVDCIRVREIVPTDKPAPAKPSDKPAESDIDAALNNAQENPS